MQTAYTDLELEWDEDRGGPTDDERDPRNLISAPEGGELYKSTAKALPWLDCGVGQTWTSGSRPRTGLVASRPQTTAAGSARHASSMTLLGTGRHARRPAIGDDTTFYFVVGDRNRSGTAQRGTAQRWG